MSESKDQTAFERRTREVLDESVAKLDGRALSRLTQARHAALEAGRKPVRPGWKSSLRIRPCHSMSTSTFSMISS